MFTDYIEALTLVSGLKDRIDSYLDTRVELIQSEINLGYEGKLYYHCLAIRPSCECPDYFALEITETNIENLEELWQSLKLLLELPRIHGE